MEEMLDAVLRVSHQVEALLGPDPMFCIVYGRGRSILLNRHGDVLFEYEDWDDPAFALDVAYAELENRWWLFLHGYA